MCAGEVTDKDDDTGRDYIVAVVIVACCVLYNISKGMFGNHQVFVNNGELVLKMNNLSSQRLG